MRDYKIIKFLRLALKCKTPKQVIRLYNYADNQTEEFDVMNEILLKHCKHIK